ncbi:protein HEXIM1-like protein [Leptotrombidium deliense]|uniref:Protein HEXIM1-like protein n=1 Tax=Leptotrombidium deliense TaxID=299467 RepID=A0A443SK97_9ACAR|nr:protein HEXIM1-like protein [Leptotrombidium deliense]
MEQTAINEQIEPKVQKEGVKKKRTRSRRHTWHRRKPYHRLGSIDDKRYWYRLRIQTNEKPLAPFNTNQFLMDDHNIREPDFEEIHKLLHYNHTNQPRRRCHSDSANDVNEGHSSDDFYSSPDDEQDFIQKQFFETYEHIHSERINSMSKSELVQEYMLLEDKMEQLEKKLKTELSPVKNEGQRSFESAWELKRNDPLLEEVNRLQEENKKLISNNEKLMCIINSRSGDIPNEETPLVEAVNSECEKDTCFRG